METRPPSTTEDELAQAQAPTDTTDTTDATDATGTSGTSGTAGAEDAGLTTSATGAPGAASPALALPRQELAAGDALGRYPVTGVLGQGGMGQVLAVRDVELGRVMAAKVIRGEASGKALHKFVLEAQVTGLLEHPGIPPVHELGYTTEGQP